MSRQLGIIERADGTRQYFAHCGGSGDSFRRLFVSSEDARKVHGAGGDYTYLGEAPLCDEREPEVVKLAIAWGWVVDPEQELRWDLGIASGTRLISPWQEDRRSDYGLQLAGGIIHLSQYCSGGWDGDYLGAVCDPTAKHNPDAKELSFEALFGQQISLCEACLASSDPVLANAPD